MAKPNTTFTAQTKSNTYYDISPYGTVTLGSTTVTLGSTTVTLDDLLNNLAKNSTQYGAGSKNTTQFFDANDYTYLLIEGGWRLLLETGGGMLLDLDPDTPLQDRKVTTTYEESPYGTVTLGSTTVTLGSTTVTLDDLLNELSKNSTTYTEV